MNVGIVGAGVAGSAVALDALHRGWTAVVFDDPDAPPSCSTTAAGMLSPFAELEITDRSMFELGVRSLERWPLLLEILGRPVFFRRDGSLLAAHPSDRPQLRRLLDLIERKTGEHFTTLEAEDLQQLEPDVSLRGDVVYLPQEGQLDSQAFISAAAALFEERQMLRRSRVSALEGSSVVTGDGLRARFDHVFDCRGLAAASTLSDLRGVRGELIWVHAPGVSIRRPVRLLHPRYRVYIVPRPDHVYIVGASEIESDDRSGITVRSTLELLSALFAVQPAFAEARILRTDVNVRPAFPDNRPRVEHGNGVTSINGLFRHGYLLAPALAQDALEAVNTAAAPARAPMETIYAAD